MPTTYTNSTALVLPDPADATNAAATVRNGCSCCGMMCGMLWQDPTQATLKIVCVVLWRAVASTSPRSECSL